MPMEFSCPHCGVTTVVGDEYIGQTGPCAQCGQMITIVPQAGAPGPGTRSQSGLSGCAWAAIIGGVLVIVGFVVLACGSFLMLPVMLQRTVVSQQQAARCSNNLRQLGLAFQRYQERTGHLPAPVVTDDEGRPLHSWRLSIAPELEYVGLSEIYTENEPWDSPANAVLLDMMPRELRCPDDVSDPTTTSSETSYVLLVGPGTPYDGPDPPALGDIAEPWGTILVVELHQSGINWLEPRDITVDELRDLLEDELSGTGPGLNHPSGTNVLFADGSVRSLPPDELLMMLDQMGR